MTMNENDKQTEPVAVDHSGLIKRIDAAIERVTQGRGLMSIPADPRSDVDLVLSECKALLQGKNPPFWATQFHPAHPEKRMLVCCPQCKLVFDGKSNRLNSEAQPAALDVGNLEYMGNSVSFIYQKMRAYKDGMGKVWQALRDNGIHPDGQTHAADAIRKALAQPVQPEQADDLRQAALIDLAYINGAKAGWNMCVADDESQFQKLTKGVVECVNVLKNTRSQATPQPVQAAEKPPQ